MIDKMGKKTLKFSPELIPLVLNKTKTSTWRLFDDKNLQIGDELTFLNAETGKSFARATITRICEKAIGDIDEADYAGHEKFESRDQMLDWYQRHYREPVDWKTTVKLIDFVLNK